MFTPTKCPADVGPMVTLTNGEQVPDQLRLEVRKNYHRLYSVKNPETQEHQALHELAKKVLDPKHVIDVKVKGLLKPFLMNDGNLHPHVRAIISSAMRYGVEEKEICDVQHRYPVIIMPIPSRL
jgi:hypothetical protein